MAFTSFDFTKVEKKHNVQQQKEQEKRKEKSTIIESIVIEPKPFNECKSSEPITLTDLTIEVKSMFQGIFVDCEGGAIEVDPTTGELIVKMYFKDSGKKPEDGMFRCIVPIENKGTTAVERLRGLNRMYNTSKCYELTDEAKEILEIFMNKNKNGNVDWNNATAELNNTRNGIQYITVMVKNLNLTKIVKKLRGVKNEKNHYVDYNIKVTRPIGLPTRTSDQNYLLEIESIDKSVFNRFMEEKLGMYFNDNGNIPMIR